MGEQRNGYQFCLLDTMVGSTGFEPVTLPMLSGCSNLLLFLTDTSTVEPTENRPVGSLLKIYK